MKAPQMWLQTPCVYALWPLALGLPTCNNNNNAACAFSDSWRTLYALHIKHTSHIVDAVIGLHCEMPLEQLPLFG